MKTVSQYRDKFGLITQADGDGGDTLNRTGLYWGAIAVLGGTINNLCDDLDIITQDLPPGRYRRHPDAQRWYSNPDSVTRDQMAPIECTLALIQHDSRLASHIAVRLKRGLLHFSTVDTESGRSWKFPDIPSPSELAVLIRAGNIPIPILGLLDLDLLWEVLAINGSRSKDGQLMLFMAIAKLVSSQSIISQLAFKILRSKLDQFKLEISRYHSEANGNNGIEPLGRLINLAMEELCK